MKPWLAIIATGILLFGCASTPSTPDWINGKSAKYPDNQYLVGRGQADVPEDARNRARADLAKILEVAVSAKSSDVTTYSSGPAGGTDSQVSRSIATRTDQIVRGIQIPETWQNPQTKSTYALAVLPRSQAAMGLRADIDRLDAATRGYVAQARGAPDLLVQIASASRALDSQRERDGVQRALQVIDVTGQGVAPEQNSGQLAADLSALLKRVHMKPQAPGSQELERMLSAALSAAGFVPDAGAAAPYVLFGSLQLDDLGVIDGWYWMRGTLEVQLTDTGSGKVRGNKRWEIKTSSPQKATAQRRTMDEADATLKRELRPAILGFATGN
ncbi:MAG TPA: LPP20 family lipoprotein [Burkholderiales bacterium]|nr:LPP20 family lipoprotein [Burkholderiales bacterium]